MNLGIWLPIFGGWLRNCEEPSMSASFDYNKDVALLADRLGFSTILAAELNLNDIKGPEEPVLEAWTTLAALASVTKDIRLMAAIRPGYRLPAIVAKMAANIDQISKGRFELNLVSAWWKEEMAMYTGGWLDHTARYQRSTEFLKVLHGMWRSSKEEPFSFAGEFYQVKEALLNPKPLQNQCVPIYAGGESEVGREMIAEQCSGYLMHGEKPELIAEHIENMNERRRRLDKPQLSYGMAAYVICRETENEAQDELKRITNVDDNPNARHSYDDFVSQSKLRSNISLEDYSVSNRGLRSEFVGTPEQIAEKMLAYKKVGLDFCLIQCSPMLDDLKIVGEKVLPLIEG